MYSCSSGGGGDDDTPPSIIGVPDTSFGNGGIVISDGAAGGSDSDCAYSIVLDGSGNIYAAGYSENTSDKDMVIWKYDSSGKLDTNFGDDDGAGGHKGFVVHDGAAGGTGWDLASSIVLDGSGNIYVAGCSENTNGDLDMVIWKYDSSGNPDNSFGGGQGFVVHNGAAGGNSDDVPSSMIFDGSGNIYVAGYSENTDGALYMVIWKYDSSGSLVTSFGNSGIVVHNGAAGGNDVASSIILDSAGNIYVAGYSENSSGNRDMAIWKYDSSGDLVTSFGNSGIVTYHDAADDYYEARSIVLDDSGNIYVAGLSENTSGDKDMVIWKYDSSGNLDESFGNSGIVVHHGAAGGNGWDLAHSIVLDSAGNIYVAGYSENTNDKDMVIWKYDSSGNPDNSFGGGQGFVVHNGAAGGNGDDEASSMIFDASGSIYVAGYSENSSGNEDMAIWKYK